MSGREVVLGVLLPLAFAAGCWIGNAERRRLRNHLTRARRAAATDSLTGLANRAGLWVALSMWEVGTQPYALLLADLDGFKTVNDAHGHETGDAVLVEVARRLVALAGGQGLVARLGGDEFVILAPAPVPATVRSLACDITRAVAQPIDAGGCQVIVKASVGAVHAMPGDPAQALMRRADTAMYQAKTSGGGRLVEYEPDNDLVDDTDRPTWRLRELRRASLVRQAVTRPGNRPAGKACA